jgi:hypothetical protein
MNKKLAELFEQAHKDVIGEDYYTGMPTTTRELDPEKFAELIVTKCISVVYDSNYNKADALAEEIYHKFWD